MRIATGLALIAILAAAPQSAMADDNVLTLEPSTEWKLAERSDKCRASRDFGEGENRVTLWLDQGGKEPSYNLTVIGRPFRSPYGRAVQIQFGDEKENLRSYISAKSSKGRPVIMMYGLTIAPPEIEFGKDTEVSEIGAERENAITAIHMSRSIHQPVKLQTGPIHAPLSFLRGCSEQLAITLARGSSFPEGSKAQPAQMTNHKDLARLIRYPTYLVRSGMDGRVQIRLTVNAKGKPTNCHIAKTNRPQLFDNTVCLGLLKHAKFRPALGASGEPRPSYYRTSVTFKVD